MAITDAHLHVGDFPTFPVCHCVHLLSPGERIELGGDIRPTGGQS